ncbi:uncharacterized protein LOC115223897 [Octopus sinensis]|uniref:Uncharacterized protein LOC115223897 n=1 Tax=Octopus sinensis TaxID=2607531 RepID=A0A6P7TK91_9MOLL|nr:uncharacterized protein LOC115223897 [Octopus sinensis]
MSQCAALNCKSVTSEGSGKTFHLFPKDAIQRQCWLLGMKRENYWPSETSVLCSNHFEPDCFDQIGQTTQLRKDAIPTIFKTTNSLKKLSTSIQPMLKGGLYKCNKCKYSTDKKPNWYKHRNKHLGLRRHCCTECNYKATTSSNLKRHLAIHADLREFKCPFCYNFFRQKIHLDKHILYKHERKRSKLDLTKALSREALKRVSSPKVNTKDSQLNTDLYNQDRILKPIQIWEIPEDPVPLSDGKHDEQSSEQELQFSEQKPQYSENNQQYSQQELRYSDQDDAVPPMVYVPPRSKKVHIVSEHQYHVMESLAQLWKKGKLCDAAIGNGSSVLMVHKIVLLAVCPKLLSTVDTYYNQFLMVNLPQTVSSEALNAFAEYIYKGHLNLDPDLLNQLRTIALCLEIDDLKQLCDSESDSSSSKGQLPNSKKASDPAPDTITLTFYPPQTQQSSENEVNLSSSFAVSSHNLQSVMKSQANVTIKKEMTPGKAQLTRFPSQKDLVEPKSSANLVNVARSEVRDIYEHFQNNDLVSTSIAVCDEEQNLTSHVKSTPLDVNLQQYTYLPLNDRSQVPPEPTSSLHDAAVNNFSPVNHPEPPLESLVKMEPVIIEDDSDDDSLLPSPSSTFMDSSHISSSRPIDDSLSEIITTNCSTNLSDSLTNNHCQDGTNSPGINLSHIAVSSRHKGDSFLNPEIFRYNRQVERHFTSKEINSTLNDEIYTKDFR